MKRFLTLLRCVPIFVLFAVVSASAGRQIADYPAIPSFQSPYPSVSGIEYAQSETATGMLEIGFPFLLDINTDGTSFVCTKFNVHPGGTVYLYPSTFSSAPYTAASAPSSAPRVIAPFNSANIKSKVGYKLIGTEPNRVLVIYWTEMQAKAAAAPATNAEMQVRLYETTGKIEMIYGPNVVNLPSNALDGTIYIAGRLGSRYNNYKPKAAIDGGIEKVASSSRLITTANNNLQYLTSGTTYTFYHATSVDAVYPLYNIYNKALTYTNPEARPAVNVKGMLDGATPSITYSISGPFGSPNSTVVYTATTAGGDVNIPVTSTIANPVMNFTNATGLGVGANGTLNYSALLPGVYTITTTLTDGTDISTTTSKFDVVLDTDLELTMVNAPPINSKHNLSPAGLPVSVTVKNLGANEVSSFDANVKIYFENETTPMYDQTVTAQVQNFTYGNSRLVNLPAFISNRGYGKYRVVATSIINGDMNSTNDRYPRLESEEAVFYIAQPIEIEAYGIAFPTNTVVLGRPITPTALAKNNGTNDLAEVALATMRITRLSDGAIINTFTKSVDAIAAYPVNTITEIVFDENLILSQPGQYRVTFTISSASDVVTSNNTYEKTITVERGLEGVYTIGGTNANYPTIQAAVADLYQKGVSNPVVFELTDANYIVDPLVPNGPALDLSSTIVGNNSANTITFRPSAAMSALNTPININLNTNSGIGVLLGQNSNPANTQASINNVYFGKKKLFANAGGYIIFDGLAKKSLKFNLQSNSNFRAAFYLGQGASNNTIKNCQIFDAALNPADQCTLPANRYNAYTGDFEFEQNLNYTAGIAIRSVAPYETSKFPLFVINSIGMDTLVNTNNLIHGNIINGFAYGIAGMGIGVLQNNQNGVLIHKEYYNHSNTFTANTISNSARAGIFLGFDKNSIIESNKIEGVTGTCDMADGIMLGANRKNNYTGYNTMSIRINANEVSGVTSTSAACGINVTQSQNEYFNADPDLTLYTPTADENTIMTNNVIWGISSTGYRCGINLQTERRNNLLTPYTIGYKNKNNIIVNNTIRLEEDAIATASFSACLNIAQVYNTKVINNAMMNLDNSYSTGAAALVNILGQMPINDKLLLDRNVYYYNAANSNDLVKFTETNEKDIVYPNTGLLNEFKNLQQWQYWTKQDVNSAWYNFSNELAVTNNKLRVSANPLNSRLNNYGANYREISMGANLTLADLILSKDFNGNSRGVAGERFDVGAFEFSGQLYLRDFEVVKVSAPSTYKSSVTPFNDVNYVMTTDPVAVKALVRNNSASPISKLKVRATIYTELPDSSKIGATDIYTKSGVNNFVVHEAFVDIDAYGAAEVDFQTTGGPNSTGLFAPLPYYAIGEGYTVPTEFTQMKTTVTPKYKIEIAIIDNADQYSLNNKLAEEYRFFIKKSQLSILVSSENVELNLNTVDGTTSDNALAGKLNYDSLQRGLNSLGWKQLAVRGEAPEYDFDVFNRSVWEPKAVDYTIYRTMFWTDGSNNKLTRVQEFDIKKFADNEVNPVTGGAKKNLIMGSEEFLRKNVADSRDFLRKVFKADTLTPHTPMGVDGLGALLPFDNKTIKGLGLSLGLVETVKATGFNQNTKVDALPYPALMKISNIGEGVSVPAYTYIDRDAATVALNANAGVATSAVSRNVIYLGQDWRHFADINRVLRGILDYCSRNGSDIVPVELFDFDAIDRNKKVEISWATVSEYNSDRFEIERAEATETGATAFKTIATESAAGNSTSIRTYGPIVDINVDYGRSYIYRLRSVDATGESTLSNEVEVSIDNFFGVTPNPAATVSTYTFNVGDAENVQVELYDINGKMVQTIYNGIANGNHTVDINVSELTNGTYTIVTKTATKVFTSRLNVRK